MKALASAAGRVPFRRILAEHRRWLLPVTVVLAVDLVLLVGFVLPLARAAATTEERAQAARQALAAAERDFTRAEALRDGDSLATRELQTFYGEVLPHDFRSAQRITHLRLAQMAAAHNVRYQRMAASPERERDSTLERLRVNMQLAGEYEDIRAFLHQLETSSEFVVIENMRLGEGDENDALRLELDLSTYYLAGKNAG
jgi:Tfp pilus assembly protein PilO